ncbi:hypothetical protein [Actinacidiphila bryophytorum]|uniref:hypothetical protein n=1 Tax=Actinacidiphila bryophytorum TaxID=1436133 RepID=UPI002176C551|nr:hypothetical protein [Actinacidiphila bryophytorum]UWE12767.1 hypothetical protein NYE86_31495 [Actinacidiphila bryophytorum]
MVARAAGSGGEKIVTVVEVALVDGKWKYTDLNFDLAVVPEPAEDPPEPAGPPGPPRKIAPFASPRNGLAAVRLRKDAERVYYVDVFGGVIEMVVEREKQVEYRNLTVELGASVVGGVSPLAVTEPGGLVVHYVDTNNYLCRLRHQGGWTWHWYDEAPPVSPAGGLAAMVTTDLSKVFVYYLDERSHLIEVVWPREQRAVVTDLSSAVGGVPALSPITPLSAVGFDVDSRRIYFLDVNSKPIELAYTADNSGRRWSCTNMSMTSGAPAAHEGSPLAVGLTKDAKSRVYYHDVAENTVEAHSSAGGRWAPTVPGRLANDGQGAPAAADTSALAAVLSDDSVRNYVFYQDGADHLIVLEWTGGAWVSRDLSAELRLPSAAHASPLSAVFDSGPRAYYLSSE